MIYSQVLKKDQDCTFHETKKRNMIKGIQKFVAAVDINDKSKM